jgi:hypothetical protein
MSKGAFLKAFGADIFFDDQGGGIVNQRLSMSLQRMCHMVLLTRKH